MEDRDWVTDSKRFLKADNLDAVSDIFEMDPSGEAPVLHEGVISGGMWKLTAAVAGKFCDRSVAVPEGAADVIDCVGDVLKVWAGLTKEEI